VMAKSETKVGGGDAATVYVEGISYSASEADVEGYFASCGPIASLRMPRWHDSGKPRGYAHVEFESRDARDAALELDGGDLLGRYLKVSAANERVAPGAGGGGAGKARPEGGCKSVFLKNLPYDADEDALRAVLSKYGEVTSVRVVRDSGTQRSKGFAYAEFGTTAAADAVVRAAALKCGGRPLIVDYETGAPKKSFRDADGRAWSKTGVASTGERGSRGRGGSFRGRGGGPRGSGRGGGHSRGRGRGVVGKE
jgi:nucleolin